MVGYAEHDELRRSAQTASGQLVDSNATRSNMIASPGNVSVDVQKYF